MFKSFFSSSKEPNKSSNVATVEEIHMEFNNAGEELIQRAKEIINGPSREAVDKADRLSKLGFSSCKDVVSTYGKRMEIRKVEEVSKAMEYFYTRYPKYKFVTSEIVNSICAKYNLVLGPSNKYTGDIPEKNLRQIEEFFKEESELNTYYWERHPGGYNMHRIDKAHYEARKAADRTSGPRSAFGPLQSVVGKGNQSLKIVAPLKDMNSEGMKLVNNQLVPKDPVVLCPASYNGSIYYCIVTAWGEEAADELVVNQVNN